MSVFMLLGHIIMVCKRRYSWLNLRLLLSIFILSPIHASEFFYPFMLGVGISFDHDYEHTMMLPLMARPIAFFILYLVLMPIWAILLSNRGNLPQDDSNHTKALITWVIAYTSLFHFYNLYKIYVFIVHKAAAHAD